MRPVLKIPQLHKIPKKLLLLSTAIVVFTVAAISCTLAYMTAKTTPVTNNFTPGVANITVSEPNGSSYTLSNNTVSKVVAITNPDSRIDGSNPIPVYVRVRLVPVMRYSSGSGLDGTGEPVNVTYNLPSTNWVLIDGYYYYKGILQPGQTTADLIDTATVSGGLSSGRKLEIQVIADSIQTIGNTEREAWHMDYNGGNWEVHVS